MILDPPARVGERFARKAFEALNPGGVAVLWETVYRNDGPMPLDHALEAAFDLCASPTTPPRDLGEYERLLGGIGYRGVDVVSCMGGQTSFLVARKP
jgi:hypothetical protein